MNESGFESGNHTISFNEADKVARTGIMMLIKREQENDFGDRTDGRKEFFSFRILEKKVSSIAKRIIGLISFSRIQSSTDKVWKASIQGQPCVSARKLS